MSDFRILYSSTADTDNFVSQQMQVAHVRIRGEDDARKQEQIFGERKQQITQFLQFCDNQHRLAGRQHSHFRVRHRDVEMQYINNTGQPVVYVSPPAGKVTAVEEPIPEGVVIESARPGFRAVAVFRYYGPVTTIKSLTDNASVDITPSASGPSDGGDGEGPVELPDENDLETPDPTPTALIYMTDDLEEEENEWADAILDKINTLYADELDAGVAVYKLPSRMRYLGWALGGASGDSLGYVVYDQPIPFFVGGVELGLNGSEPKEDYQEDGGKSWPMVSMWVNEFSANAETSWPPPYPLMADGTPSGLQFQGESYPEAPLPVPWDRDKVMITTLYNVYPTVTGPSASKLFSLHAVLSVNVFLVEDGGTVAHVSSGSASATLSDEFFTRPASNRLNGAFEVIWFGNTGWIYGSNEIVGEAATPYTTGLTSKLQKTKLTVSAHGRSNPMRWNVLVMPDLFPSMVEETDAGSNIDEEFNSNPNLEVEQEPEEEIITDVDDLGFVEDANPFRFIGSIRLEFSSLPPMEGWRILVSFGADAVELGDKSWL